MANEEHNGVLSRFWASINYWLSDKGIPDFVSNTLLFFFFFLISTMIHEAGHVIAGKIMCEGGAGLSAMTLLTGMTTVGECSLFGLQVTALAGPLFAFIIGLWIWYGDEDDKIRVLGFLMFTLSGVFQLYPVGMSDGQQFINFGGAPVIVWGLFIILSGITANLLVAEVTEKEPWNM